MEILGLLASIVIGLSLGLIGGGGSTLTVPILVYLFKIDAVIATGYSLFVVGVTSLIGGIRYYKDHLVNLKTGIWFGIPAIASVFVTRFYLVPFIPDRILQIGNFQLNKGVFMLLLFALLMIVSAYRMILSNQVYSQEEFSSKELNHLKISIVGGLVGIVTGLVGVGGGFLVIPSLVFLCRLPMKEAIGTSLVIIAAKSLIGFSGEMSHQNIDWNLLFKISFFAIIGILGGYQLSKKIDGEKLKPAFGWFILCTGIFIIIKETLLK
jgi:uncharacterized protein